MKFRYKPPYGEEVTFDPGTEIICPLCGNIKPVPFEWQTHTTFVWCENKEHHANDPKYYHNSLYTDINHFIDDDEPQLTAYLISKGKLYEEDVKEWLEKRTLWHIMYTCGNAPKWKVEPEPFWRARIKKAIKADNLVAYGDHLIP